MISFYLLWCIGYLILLGWLSQQWPKGQPSLELSRGAKNVSLIIPFRNEAQNVSRLLKELKKLEAENLEILLIDDQSEDDSFARFNQGARAIAGLSVLKSPGLGKKAALDFGIKNSKGEIVLTSDADCSFPEFWLDGMLSSFEDPPVQLVAGPVLSRLNGKGFFQKFQQIEWGSILLLTQFSFSQNNPLMCSGANLAFRKSAFSEVRGYQGNEQILSGDDEFLLKKIANHFGPGSCRYLPFQECLVWTAAQDSWGSLINQRIRWAGKWRLHRSFFHVLSSFGAFVFQVVWGMSFILLLKPGAWLLLILIWGLKIYGEKKTLGKVLKSFEVRLPFGVFILTSLIHPVYVLCIAFGSIRGKFAWKGRSN
jgi:poly-beta-1,6-N-acetyl-D-glucosamine synthase